MPFQELNGIRFEDYVGRGVPDGPDDGTLAPWAIVATLIACACHLLSVAY